uniref:DUF1995 domain-containing protein n=1 Tax=Pseudo-nitzschia australis TaxID=44445 RepID=A0A7S4AM00_9STRA|eukprot:CAMPEP_0168193296 /NCGR_PEP_ID=MMETSP0139_2-20121125/18528_1 /TAXON_ID=44445 /ORGANISM="Pseudo-nitzschia australis, Strain 10249 10 AB" /LENGTH=457 /DNA_ID=CAMNT_0008116637 /DNA_START=122 /DNA_END=1495 /DNA_ORIENTATION=-
MTSNVQWIKPTVMLLVCCTGSQLWSMVASFEGPTTFRMRHPRRIAVPVPVVSRRSKSALLSAASDDDNSMRRMLEESWNTSKMGRVPVDPEAAAKEAYSSILQAAGAKAVEGEALVEDDNMAGIFFVDLLLPAYDMSLKQEGVNLYDEVVAVEYCIALADCFKGKTEIIVRDDSTVLTVKRILKAREESEQEKVREAKEKERAQEEKGDVVEANDGDFVFGDGNVVDDAEDTDGEDNDDFRKKLLASWNDVPDSTSGDGADISPPSKPKKATVEPTIISTPKKYRLASLFGNAKVIEGPDMATIVVGALRSNALPADDEDNIVILSARGNDEMVAVRALVAKYGTQKKIILVNCQFRPVPRELLTAETVYSVLPLAGKKKTNNDNQTRNDDDEGNQQASPKIVVLRRYPKDWEVFVDVGIGYELVETVSVNNQNRRGLPMDFIARSITRHLEYVSRR